MFYYRTFEFERRWYEDRGAERGWTVLPPQNFFFEFRSPNRNYWCILGNVFSQFSCFFHSKADEFSLLLIYRVAQNKIPHQTICNISTTSGLILKILKAA